MTYRDIAAEFKQLPINERLLLLEELVRSLRRDVAATMKLQTRAAPKLWRGMLKPIGPMPSDQELEDAYVEYLAEKYL